MARPSRRADVRAGSGRASCPLGRRQHRIDFASGLVDDHPDLRLRRCPRRIDGGAMTGEDRIDLRLLILRQPEIASEAFVHRAVSRLATPFAHRSASIPAVAREQRALEHDPARDSGGGDEHEGERQQHHDAPASGARRRLRLRAWRSADDMAFRSSSLGGVSRGGRVPEPVVIDRDADAERAVRVRHGDRFGDR